MTSMFSELLVSAVELVELESLQLRERAKSLVQSLVMMVIAGGLLLTGAIWLVWAGFAALSAWLSPAVAALIIGGVSCLVGGVLLWLGRQR